MDGIVSPACSLELWLRAVVPRETPRGTEAGSAHTPVVAGGPQLGSRLPVRGLARGPWRKASWFARRRLVHWPVSAVPKGSSQSTVSLECI